MPAKESPGEDALLSIFKQMLKANEMLATIGAELQAIVARWKQQADAQDDDGVAPYWGTVAPPAAADPEPSEEEMDLLKSLASADRNNPEHVRYLQKAAAKFPGQDGQIQGKQYVQAVYARTFPLPPWMEWVEDDDEESASGEST